MTAFNARPILAGLKPFQKRTVNHVIKRFYHGAETTDRFLVADETGLGKSVVAAGVVARAIEHLETVDEVGRIDVVYMCSNTDLAKQNIDRVNVTRQTDVIESGRLSLLPLELARLNAPPAENTAKRVNFISLTPGTSFNDGQRLGNAEERAAVYLILEELLGEREERSEPKLFPSDIEPTVVELLRGGSGERGFRYHINRLKRRHPEGFEPSVRNDFRKRATERGLMRHFKKLLRSEEPAEALRSGMPDFIRDFRAVLAEVGLECLEPDLIILDEFQRFQDLLRAPSDNAELVNAAELARQFLNYDDAKLLLLSATPYKALTSGQDEAGEDHAEEFTELLGFLARDEPAWMTTLDKFLARRRRQLAAIEPGDNATSVERHLKKYMCRTERPQLGDDNMLTVIPMAPNDVRPADLRSLASLTKLSRAAGAGNPVEYWKSVPYFANFLGEYQLGRVLDGSVSGEGIDLGALASSTTTIDRDRFHSFGRLEGDNAKYRAVEHHVLDAGLWKLLWMPPSCPYNEPSGVYADVGSGATKQVLFSAWNATPNSVSTLLSYEAERRIMSLADEEAENTAEARARFTARLAWRVRDGAPQAMSALGLVVPHAEFAELVDPLKLIEQDQGQPVEPRLLRERAETIIRGRMREGEPYADRTLAGSYYGAGKALPPAWKRDREAAVEGIASVDELASADPSMQADEAPAEGSNFMVHAERMLDLAETGGGAWREGTGDLALNSPANCVYRALGRVLPGSFDKVEHWRAALFAAEGLRTLFNRQDATVLIDSIYPGLDYWQAVLRYCADGNLQAVLDEYVFQLRSQQPRGPMTVELLRDIAAGMRRALSLTSATLRAKDPGKEGRGLALATRFAVRYGGGRSEDGAAQRLPDVRAAFNSPFWPFVLTSTSVGQEGIDFHWWSHSVIHWNVPTNPVDFEQREGRVHRYMGHAVRKNVAAEHWSDVMDRGAKNPWAELFKEAEASAESLPANVREFAPYWVQPGEHKIERRLLDHPLSRDVPRTQRMLSSLATYRLALGQARQDDLMETIRNHEVRPLDLRPSGTPKTGGNMSDEEPSELPAPKDLLNAALNFAERTSKSRVEFHRRRHPDFDASQLVKLLDKDLVVALTSQGVGVGTAAAAPGVGTSVALVMAGGEAAATMNWTAVYILALAEVQGVSIIDIERKRTLLLTVMTGGGAQRAASKVAGRTGKFWSSKLVSKVPAQWLHGVNSVLGKNFVTKYGTKQGIVVLGKVVPFGVGAAIGGTMNFVMAQGLIKSARRVFEIEVAVDAVVDEEDLLDEPPLREEAVDVDLE
ncbi:C-terminal helicase domain-containing protein [Arthrobacter rhombi]|uniref:C-terminal helicase domain-containing protein n=1 Tax=Arthrobacter rhombi TaxID=71253 RepID=UPI003FD0A19E